MKAFGCLLETISGSSPSFFDFQVSLTVGHSLVASSMTSCLLWPVLSFTLIVSLLVSLLVSIVL